MTDSISTKYISDLLLKMEVPSESVGLWSNLIILAYIILIAIIADVVTKRIFINLVSRIVEKTTTSYDDILLERGVFSKLAHLAPALVVFFMVPIFMDITDFWNAIFLDITTIWMIWIMISFFNVLLEAFQEIYLHFPVSENRPITGYVQLVKILIYIFAVLLIIQIVFNYNMSNIFKGLGAMAAILILVFKDTILGLVASVQLSGNKMVKPGDWIEMPAFNADGTVLEITLNTVKVQNWDKTIAMIPTYAMVSNSFKNWKGMEESGGRRIKRSVNIDNSSVKFCSNDLLAKLETFYLLKDYITERRNEIAIHNTERGFAPDDKINGRGLTNLGIFRRYLEAYLKQHPKIHDNMTFLVRQLQPTEKGIPIEVYVFSNDQAWANYEAIQADIFDHIFAILPEFELRSFQLPGGFDFKNFNR